MKEQAGAPLSETTLRGCLDALLKDLGRSGWCPRASAFAIFLLSYESKRFHPGEKSSFALLRTADGQGGRFFVLLDDYAVNPEVVKVLADRSKGESSGQRVVCNKGGVDVSVLRRFDVGVAARRHPSKGKAYVLWKGMVILDGRIWTPINFAPSVQTRVLARSCGVGRISDTKAGKPLFDAQLQLFLYPKDES